MFFLAEDCVGLATPTEGNFAKGTDCTDTEVTGQSCDLQCEDGFEMLNNIGNLSVTCTATGGYTVPTAQCVGNWKPDA